MRATYIREGEKVALLHCWWEYKLVQPLWRTIWRFLKKIKIELSYDPSIPFLGIYPEKTLIQNDTRTSMFIVALFTIAKTWKQTKCPLTDERIKNMWYILEYYSATKKNEIMPFVATWMDLEIIILSEASQRERHVPYGIAYIWNLKKWYKLTYLQNRNRLIDIENKLRVTKGERGRR